MEKIMPDIKSSPFGGVTLKLCL